MKFKIDENLPYEIKLLLTQAGHDALTVNDQGLTGNPDTNLAAVCGKEGRAFITCDLDFSDIRAYPPEKISRNYGDPVRPSGQTHYG
jgi:predicted nuclease of predicted toxin-antitoxin system